MSGCKAVNGFGKSFYDNGVWDFCHCPACERIAELESELAEEIFVSDTHEKRIAELEAVAEAAVKALREENVFGHGLGKLLRAAGYLSDTVQTPSSPSRNPSK